MKTVITYWQCPEDEADFFDFLNSTFNAVASESIWHIAKADINILPISDYAVNSGPSQLYIGLPDQLTYDTVAEHVFDGVKRYGFDQFEQEVVVYSRGRFADGKCGQSNICAYSKYFDNNKQLVDKSTLFLSFMKKTCSWIRRMADHKWEYNSFFYRCTKRSYDQFKYGGIQSTF